jgi:hypothetical protein
MVLKAPVMVLSECLRRSYAPAQGPLKKTSELRRDWEYEDKGSIPQSCHDAPSGLNKGLTTTIEDIGP